MVDSDFICCCHLWKHEKSIALKITGQSLSILQRTLDILEREEIFKTSPNSHFHIIASKTWYKVYLGGKPPKTPKISYWSHKSRTMVLYRAIKYVNFYLTFSFSLDEWFLLRMKMMDTDSRSSPPQSTRPSDHRRASHRVGTRPPHPASTLTPVGLCRWNQLSWWHIIFSSPPSPPLASDFPNRYLQGCPSKITN